MEQTSIILDQKSDLHRICPQCGLEFMAEHRSRKFCSEQHHNDFNNALKRKNAKISEDIIPIQEANRVIISEEAKIQERIAKNIGILSTLVIDLKKGSSYYLMDLVNQGFDFAASSFRFVLFNAHNSYCLQFGDYKMYRTTPELVLIYKNQGK